MDVLILSDQWIVLIVSTMSDIVKEINKLSGGVFTVNVQKWEATKNTPNPDWNARSRMWTIRDLYINQCRMKESELDNAASFKINGVSPLQVGRTIVGLGATETPGGTDPEYVHYCYLQLATPLIRGEVYQIDCLKNTHIFEYDRETVARSIKINQVGYMPDSKKFAYIGCHLYEIGPLTINSTMFEVRNAKTDASVFTGVVKLRDANSSNPVTGNLITGENVYELDFSEFRQQGEFYIYVPGVGRSWTFKQSFDVYGEVFYTCARGLFHQRCGVELPKSKTPWYRAKCHSDPIGENQMLAIPTVGEFGYPKTLDRFDTIGATSDMTKLIIDHRGGWHDAADWDRNNAHYTPLFDLLYAYELAPKSFTDSQLNLLLTKNSIPDILDEAEWGLRAWAATMNKEGGVSGMIETNTHPTMNAKVDYTAARRTRWDSLLFCAAAAMLAEHLRPFNMTKSKLWEQFARRAYSFGTNPSQSVGSVDIPAKKNRGTGDPYTVHWEEKEEYLTSLLVHAKLRMHSLFQDPEYLNGVKELMLKAKVPINPGYTNVVKDYAPWMFYKLLERTDLQPKDFVKNFYLRYADKLVGFSKDSSYRHSWLKDQDIYMAWGATAMCNYSRLLLIAHKITGDSKYRDAAIYNFDFALGSNPMGMSWTTGLGYSYPVNIQSDLSTKDGIDDPIPGLTIYGVTGGTYQNLKNTIWQFRESTFKVPDLPVWRRWSPHQTLNTGQCEYTIQETISATILSSALLMPEGWTPSEELLTRQPKPKSKLYGYHYLP